MGTKPPSGPQPISTTRAGAAGSEARTNGQTAASQRSSGITEPQPTLAPGGWRMLLGGPVRCWAHGLHRCSVRPVAGVHPGLAGLDGQACGGTRGRLPHIDVADQLVVDQLVAD